MKKYISPEMEQHRFLIPAEDICKSGVDAGGKPTGSDEVYDEDIVPIQ